MRSDLLWTYLAQVLNLGAGLVVLPLALHYLSLSEINLWLVFIPLGSLALLLEFGLSPALTLQSSYVYAGAHRVMADGLPSFSDAEKNSVIHLDLLQALMVYARQACRKNALFAAIILFFVFSLYVIHLQRESPLGFRILDFLAWIVYAFSFICTLASSYLPAMLQGRGQLSLVNRSTVIFRIFFIVLAWLVLQAGGGLIGLCVAWCISTLLSRLQLYRYFHYLSWFSRRSPGYLWLKPLDFAQEIKSALFPHTRKLAMVQFGSFMIQRGNMLIASAFLGAAMASSYNLSMNIMLVFSGLSVAFSQANLHRLAVAQFERDHKTISEIHAGAVILAGLIFLFSCLLLILIGPVAIVALGAKTTLLPTPWLTVITLILFLEIMHSLAGSFLASQGQIPFHRAALFSGVSIVTLSFIGVQMWGVAALILSQAIVQATYNNWRWPLLVYRQSGLTMAQWIRAGIRQVLVLFSVHTLRKF